MLGFSITWTKNFQLSKLGLEKGEEWEIKLGTLTASYRKQGNSRKTSVSFPFIRKLLQASDPYPSEGRQKENHNQRKLPNWSHGSQPCEWNYEPCHIGATQGHGGEFWQNMVHCRREWQTTSVLLRTPWTVWKGKKIGHWKRNSPGG